MKMITNKNNLLIAFILAMVFAGCKDRWEEHIKVSDPSLTGSVLDLIAENPDFSQFYDLLQQTGLDTVLTQPKSFTVWAPTNAALQTVDPELINDATELKRFVGNHISNQQYYTHTSLPDTARIETLNGKFIFWGDVKSKFDTDPLNVDMLAANGVVQSLSAPLLPKQSSWEFLLNSGYGQKQAEFIESLQGQMFVDSLAPRIGVDPLTGEPIYDTLAGMVPFNPFFHRGYDISNEDSLNTFIILTDEAFESEVQEFREYFNTGRSDSTNYFTSLAIAKDLVFRGMYTEDELPSVLYSKDSVEIAINKNNIVHTEETSNGIVYVLDNIEVSPQEKLKPIVIQGESAYPFRHLVVSHPEQAGAVDWRLKSVNGNFFEDILAYDHGISGFNIRYNPDDVYSTTYDVYMTTYNDFNGGTDYKQKIAFKDPSASDFLYSTVPAGEYARIKVGTYTVDRYGNIDVFLVSDLSTDRASNPLNLDYIELVPVIN